MKITIKDTSSLTPLEIRGLSAMFTAMDRYVDDTSEPANDKSPDVRGFTAEQCETANTTTTDYRIITTVNPVASGEVIRPMPIPKPLPLSPTAKDVNGLPWDERIHSSSKAVNADGSWRIRRNLPDEVLAAVTAELKGEQVPAHLDPEVKQLVEQAIEQFTTPLAGELIDQAAQERLAAAMVMEPETAGFASPTEDEMAPYRDHGDGYTVETGGTGDTSGIDAGDENPQPESDVQPVTSPSTDPVTTPENGSENTSPTGQTATTDASHSDDLGIMPDPATGEPVKPTEIDHFWYDTHKATSWAPIKGFLSSLIRTDDWSALTVDEQNELRKAMWNDITARGIVIDHTTDPTAFICWACAQTDGDIIGANYHVLMRDPAFVALSDNTKAKIKDAVQNHVAKNKTA